MNEREISEIRRRFRPEKSNITHVRGCYVNEQREIITQFNQSLLITPQEEAEQILTVLKRTLSGTLNKNLLDITFTTQQVADSDEHRLLMALRDSSLEDETALQTLYQRIIDSVSLEGNYMILLAHDRYDVPYRSGDGETLDDASSEVFSYILCSICPVKMTKPALSYQASDNMLHNRTADWVLSVPELGFLFPAFDDRSTNLYNALAYSRSASESHEAFIQTIFRCEAPMPAAEQKETFGTVLESSLGDHCSYEVLEAVHEQFQEMTEEHKASKDPSPLLFSKSTVTQVLKGCDLPDETVERFSQKYDEAFGADAELSPRNITGSRLEIRTPDVSIQVKPECSHLIDTQVIHGVKYILIRADEDVEVNGVRVQIQKPKAENKQQ